ncbi:16875_t:CDS:2, partial [Racocetra fulgida]
KKNAVNFDNLYNNITNAETQNEITNQDVITCYYLIKVRSQPSNSVNDDLLQKKKEWALKIYNLFSEIGIEKIQRVKSLTVSSKSKLSQDEINQIL